MNASNRADFVAAERERIQLEYHRRAREISPDPYAAWQPASRFMLESRNRTGAFRDFQAGIYGVTLRLREKETVAGFSIRYRATTGHFYLWGLSLSAD